MKTIIKIKDSYCLERIAMHLLSDGLDFDFRNNEESYDIYVEKEIEDTNEYLNRNGILYSVYELLETCL